MPQRLINGYTHLEDCKCDVCRKERTKTTTTVAAGCDDVMVDQLIQLLYHVESGCTGCSDCDRYSKIRELLLADVFPEERVQRMAHGKP
jgi:hypothetical protein